MFWYNDKFIKFIMILILTLKNFLEFIIYFDKLKNIKLINWLSINL